LRIGETNYGDGWVDYKGETLMAALLVTLGLRRRKAKRRSLADETLTIQADERSRYACGGWNEEEEE
jgi:hypothetical protein